jgi:hypothetical protein
MKYVALTLGWIAFLASAIPVPAATIFNANFDNQPLGPLATEPNTDPTPLGLPDFIIRDDGSCRVDVVSSAGNLANNCLDIQGDAAGLSAAGFANPTTLVSGQYQVSFDWVALTSQSDNISYPAIQNQFNIVTNNNNSTTESFGLRFNTDGHYMVHDSAGYHTISPFTVGVSDHVDLDFNVGTGAYTLSIDGVEESTGSMLGGNFYSTVFESNGRNLAPYIPIDFAIDNLLVSSVPEPSTLALFGVGAFGLATYAPRWRQQSEKSFRSSAPFFFPTFQNYWHERRT